MTTSCDVLIVGGGILGLWAAKYACDAGLKVALVDKGRCGGAGSNGLLGALSPHLPNAMNDKKRFQLEALHDLPGLAAELHDRTGIETGYRQCGRLMPIRVDGFAKRMERCVREADTNWELGARRYEFEIREAAQYEDWLNPELAPLGVAYDGLSALAAPRLVTAALKTLIKEEVNIIEGFEFGSFDPERRVAISRDGDRKINAGQLILSAGYQTYDLLASITGLDLGRGVKGHSALFHLKGTDRKPILYDDGVYVVPHGGGLVAVGSSSENEWSDENEIEEALCEPFIERAKILCPPLAGADLVSYWAGVRPRSHTGDPLIGQIAPDNPVFVCTGGFKISFGIAHRLAKALVQRMVGKEDPIELPECYDIAFHAQKQS